MRPVPAAFVLAAVAVGLTVWMQPLAGIALAVAAGTFAVGFVLGAARRPPVIIRPAPATVTAKPADRVRELEQQVRAAQDTARAALLALHAIAPPSSYGIDPLGRLPERTALPGREGPSHDR